jgi:NifU-like N terminal domain
MGFYLCFLMQVVDHYEKPRNVGSFDKNDPNVGTGLVGAPACGDVMKLQIKVSKDGSQQLRSPFPYRPATKLGSGLHMPFLMVQIGGLRPEWK